VSPSEVDLRAALGDGDGDEGLDVDRVIAGAQAARAQRRVRLLTTAAVVVVVAGGAVGGSVLFGDNPSSQTGAGVRSAAGGASRFNDNGSAAAGAPMGTDPTLSARSPSGRSAAGGAPLAPTSGAPACPAAPPVYRLPGGGGSGQFGSSGPLFGGSVVTAVVCSYPSSAPVTASSAPVRVVLTGDRARTLTDGLENAPTKKKAELCPAIRSASERKIAIIGVGSYGRRLGTVTTVVGRPACAVVVTNGTAVRYDWSPPAPLTIELLPRPRGGLSHGPVVGSAPPS
jgi:hypothetical protein